MKYTLIAIVLAAVIVAVVGYIVLSAKDNTPSSPAPAKTQQQNSSTTKQSTDAKPAPGAEAATESKNPLATLKFPGSGASKEDYTAFNEKVYGMSVAVNKITITGCVADPLVIRVPKATQFTIHNNDATEHKLSNLGSTTPVVLPAKGDAQVTLKDIGVYGYACDATSQRSVTAGIVAVMDAK